MNDDNPSATIAQGPRSSAVTFMGVAGVTYHILVSEYPPLHPSPDPGFDLYEAPLSKDPILYFTLTTPQLTSSPSALTISDRSHRARPVRHRRLRSRQLTAPTRPGSAISCRA